MLRFSNHFLFALVALFWTVCCNFYFFSLIAPNVSLWVFLGIALVLFCLFALALELLCFSYWSKPILLGLLAIAGGFAYSINSLKVGVTPDMIHSIINANPRELSETLNVSFLSYLFWIFLVPSVVILCLRVKKLSLKKALFTRIIFVLGYLFVLFVLWFGVGKEIIFLFKQNRTLYYVINPISPIRSYFQYFSDQEKNTLHFEQIGLDAQLKKSLKPKVIVFVIGESARSANFSLNGYLRETNPLLSLETNLVSLKDFSSCGVITAISVPCMMTNYTHQTYTKRYLSEFRENLLDVTERVGIKTYYLGNNGGGCIGSICVRLPKDQVKFYNDGHLDGVMLKDLHQVLQNAQGNTFVVLHQMGSHGQNYFQRYSKEFAHFHPICETSEIQNCSLESLRNTYDNSILYTDYFLSQAIQELKSVQNRFEVALWYVSDHGESLGENGMYMHGGLPYFLAPETQTHIPSILWFGKDFQGMYAILKAKENQKFNHDYVFHTLLRLWGIQTSEYDSKLDLFY